MGWRSTTGDVAPQYYEAEGIRWLRSCFGGLVTTCGLLNVGAPAPDSAASGNGLHGRIGHTPAGNLSVSQGWEGDDYVMRVTGTMRETRVFGENLTLTRTVTMKLGDPSFRLHDIVTNEGFNASPLMLLYHCNIGWPAVDRNSDVVAPTRFIAPRDATAADNQENWHRLDAPTHGYAEKVYYHDMAPQPDGTVTVAILNERVGQDDGFGVYVKYNKNQLPRFTQWKQMGEQDYVVGLEPCNCGVEGRDVDASLGLLETLEPGESRSYDLEFGPVTTKAHADHLKALARAVTPQFVDSYKAFVKKV